MGMIKISNDCALIVVDPLKDFEEGGALPVSGVEGEVSRDVLYQNHETLLGMSFGRVVIATEMHPEDHIEMRIYGLHGVIGTEGSRITPRFAELLSIYPDHYILHKGQDPRLIGYSVCFGSDFPVHIDDLRRKKITKVFVSMYAFTHCVGESAIDYARQLFEVYVIRDATMSIPKPFGDVEVMEKKLALYAVKTVYMEDLYF